MLFVLYNYNCYVQLQYLILQPYTSTSETDFSLLRLVTIEFV